jgi:hypothetical protein
MQTISNLSALLVTKVLPKVWNNLEMKAPLLTLFPKGRFTTGGDTEHRLVVSENQQVGWIADNGETPGKGNTTTKKFTFTKKYISGQLQLTYLSMLEGAAGLNDAGDVLAMEEESIQKAIKRAMGIAMYGTGTGRLGLVSATNGTTTITFDGPYDLARYFKKGMLIAVQTGNTSTARGTCTISAVNYATNTITVDSVPGSTADNDVVVFGLQNTGTSYDAAINGLLYHVDDGSTAVTYQGKTRSDEQAYKAGLIGNGGTNISLTEDLMWQAFIKRTLNSDCELSDPIHMRCDLGMIRTYAKMFQGQYIQDPGKAEGGLLAANYKPKFNGIEIDYDLHCPYYKIFFLTPSSFEVLIAHELKPLLASNGDFLIRAAGANNKYNYEGAYTAGLQLVCYAPAQNTLLEDVSQDITKASNG